MKQKTGFGSNRKKALRIVLAAAILLTALILLRGNKASDGVSTPEGRAAFLQQFIDAGEPGRDDGGFFDPEHFRIDTF